MRIKAILFSLVLAGSIFGIAASAEAKISVKGYYKSNGTYVAPYTRSSPNAFKYDNYRYKSSSSSYNKSYYAPTKNYSSSWYTPYSGR